jgi:hypothetical protein
MKWTTALRLMTALALVLGVLLAAGCGDDDDDDGGNGGEAAGEAQEFPAGSTLGKIQKKARSRSA